MRDGTRKQRTIISYAFRITVAVHFAILYVLFFRLPNMLIGFQHFVVGGALTILMVVIGSLFFADMLMLKHDGWTNSKLIDTCVGCIWLAVVGYLISNNLHAGIW